MSDDLADALDHLIALRRDVRAEFTGRVIDDATLMRILSRAHRAPSVGNTQPWDFTVVHNPTTLQSFADHVAAQRKSFADSLPPDRAETFDPIKIDGIIESGTGVVVSYDPTRGGPHVLGRQSVAETGVYSTVLAIGNLWLAATSEGIGVGWVSFYDPAVLRSLVALPDHLTPVAWLCVGPVDQFASTPDLERFGWRTGIELDQVVHRETYRQ